MRTKMVKRAISIILALALAIVCGVSAFALETVTQGTGIATGNVTINGIINPLTISVIHPLTVDYVIDPNMSDGIYFIAPDVNVTNMTKVPINVTISSLKSTPGGSNMFTDVDPTTMSWQTLNAAESKMYISLGIHAVDSPGWMADYSSTTHYSYEDVETQIGSVSVNSTGYLALTANFGIAFDSYCTAQHSLVLLFNLV